MAAIRANAQGKRIKNIYVLAWQKPLPQARYVVPNEWGSGKRIIMVF